MVTDKIADLIIQIKNAGMAKKETILLPYSSFRKDVLNKLRINNFVSSYEVIGHGVKKQLSIDLFYDKKGNHAVSDTKRISKPGRRIYIKSSAILPYKNGHGLVLVSTSKGILTGDEAKKERVGGELLFSIW